MHTIFLRVVHLQVVDTAQAAISNASGETPFGVRKWSIGVRTEVLAKTTKRSPCLICKKYIYIYIYIYVCVYMYTYIDIVGINICFITQYPTILVSFAGQDLAAVGRQHLDAESLLLLMFSYCIERPWRWLVQTRSLRRLAVVLGPDYHGACRASAAQS